MKKLLFLVLAVVGLGLLTACGGKSSVKVPTTSAKAPTTTATTTVPTSTTVPATVVPTATPQTAANPQTVIVCDVNKQTVTKPSDCPTAPAVSTVCANGQVITSGSCPTSPANTNTSSGGSGSTLGGIADTLKGIPGAAQNGLCNVTGVACSGGNSNNNQSSGQGGYSTTAPGGAPSAPAGNNNTQTGTGPSFAPNIIIGNDNPNTSGVYTGTCKVTQQGPNGIYFESGQGQHCNITLSQIPANWQLVIEGISFRFDGGQDILHALQGFSVKNGTIVVADLFDGAGKVGPAVEVNNRFCAQAFWADNNGIATGNRAILPGWSCSNGKANGVPVVNQ